MTREKLASDLAYVRTLAEEGRHAPLLGGSFLLFWGLLNLTAYSAHWAVLTGVLPGGDGGGFAAVWISYGVIAGVGSALLGARVNDKPGQSAIGVRTEGAIWRGVQIGIGVVAIGCIGRMLIEADVAAPNNIMAPAFALFGAALTATGMLAREKWLTAFGALSFAFAAAAGLFANAAWIYLLAAAASAVVLAWPGFILLRREPSAVV